VFVLYNHIHDGHDLDRNIKKGYCVNKRRRKEMIDTPTVRCNLAALVARKGEREGEKITIAQLSRDTGVALNTVKKYLRNELQQYDERVIGAFCKYLNCTIGDLLELVEPGVGQSNDTEH
jgi:DNA-binding Xre family transcriptional regulator